ncbi:MAG TPA: alpha/beta hydrolase-fold protein [Bryobacteraceae bacterium]|nr:alpha/beta hydrolase-fold protein [Bryobacteraceae bacterium]
MTTVRTLLIACAAMASGLAQRQPLQFEVNWVNAPKVSGSILQHRTLYSRKMKREVGYSVYLPPEYDTSGRRYPVIYWLHGSGGNETSGARIAEHFNQAIRSDQARPAIMVFPNGGKKTEYRDWPDQNVLSESMIIHELIPHVDSTYRTEASPRGRAIEGMSMGGNGALKLAFKYPELFGSVVAYAGSYKRLPLDGYFPGIATEQQAWIAKLSQWYSPDDDVFELAKKNGGRMGQLRIRFVVGTKDIAMGDAEALHSCLKELGLPHEYEILLGVAHDSEAYYRKAGVRGFQFHAE